MAKFINRSTNSSRFYKEYRHVTYVCTPVHLLAETNSVISFGRLEKTHKLIYIQSFDVLVYAIFLNKIIEMKTDTS